MSLLLLAVIVIQMKYVDVRVWHVKEIEGKPKINYVTVFERPGLQEFLSQLSKFADIVLFTAGLEGLIIFSHHCFGFLFSLFLTL